jgi:OmpA-OmpF porin, OOP family
MSLMNMIQGQLTSTLMGAIAGKLGESESGVTKALGGLVPTLLAGMIGKAGNEQGLSSLFGALAKPENAGFLGDLGGLVGTGNVAHGDPRDAAGGLVGSLFGDKVGPILAALGSFAGLSNKDSAGGLLGLAGPLIMGVLGKEILGKGLNAGGLKTLLMGEKDAIHAAVPPGIASLIGLPAMAAPVAPALKATPAAAIATPAFKDAEKKGGMGPLMWLLPLIALGGLLWFLTRGGNKPDVDVNVPAIEVPAVEVPVVTPPTIDMSALRSIPGLDLSLFPEGAENRLVNFITSDRAPCTEADCWFTLDRVTFNTGSADIDMAASSAQLSNLKLIMENAPTLQLKFGGYTDNTGNEAKNLELSQKRAEAIVAALSGMGISAERMGAEGYGSQFPVADNATAEGKAKNRRIDVRVKER